MMWLIFVLYTLMRMSNSGFVPADVADVISARSITYPSEWCNSKTGITNTFDARITVVKSGESYQGTVIFVPGGASQLYPQDHGAGTHDGIKKLEEDLYDEGFRILEIRWDDALGPDPDVKFDDAHGCQHWSLAKSLQILKDEDIGTSSDKWWPSSQSDRNAFGTSQGQVQLQHVIDRMNGTIPWAKMNRVVYGGGGVMYDYYEQRNHPDTSQAHIDFFDFMFDGAAAKCDGDPDCDDDTWLVGHLNKDSVKNSLGDANDPDTVNKVLYNTGYDPGTSYQYFNIKHYEERTGSASQKGLWNFTRDWCGAEDVNAHPLIDSIYDILGDVDDWVDFFLNGDMTKPVCPP